MKFLRHYYSKFLFPKLYMFYVRSSPATYYTIILYSSNINGTYHISSIHNYVFLQKIFPSLALHRIPQLSRRGAFKLNSSPEGTSQLLVMSIISWCSENNVIRSAAQSHVFRAHPDTFLLVMWLRDNSRTQRTKTLTDPIKLT